MFNNGIIRKHRLLEAVKASSRYVFNAQFSSCMLGCTLKRGYIEFKYYADVIHSDLTPPG